MNMAIIIDGPNFINMVINLGVENELISKLLSLGKFRDELNGKFVFRKKGIPSFGLIEFVCSSRCFGPLNNKFKPNQQTIMLNRFMREPGVHVEQVVIP